jgi:transposase
MEPLLTVPHDIWERTPREVQSYIQALETRVATLAAAVQALQEQNHALQEQLNQTSRNSSRPPSSDPPQRARSPRSRSTRRRGGQPGHPGSTRTLIPVEEVDEVVVLKPEQCTRCHTPLAAALSTCV